MNTNTEHLIAACKGLYEGIRMNIQFDSPGDQHKYNNALRAAKLAVEQASTPPVSSVEEKKWWQKLGIKFDGKWYTHPKTNTYDNLDQVVEELNLLLNTPSQSVEEANSQKVVSSYGGKRVDKYIIEKFKDEFLSDNKYPLFFRSKVLDAIEYLIRIESAPSQSVEEAAREYYEKNCVTHPGVTGSFLPYEEFMAFALQSTNAMPPVTIDFDATLEAYSKTVNIGLEDVRYALIPFVDFLKANAMQHPAMSRAEKISLAEYIQDVIRATGFMTYPSIKMAVKAWDETTGLEFKHPAKDEGVKELVNKYNDVIKKVELYLILHKQTDVSKAKAQRSIELYKEFIEALSIISPQQPSSIDFSQFKDGDRINFFLSNILRLLRTEEIQVLSNNIQERLPQPSTNVGEGMKWVNASERLPATGNVHWRYSATKKPVRHDINLDFFKETTDKEAKSPYEWLDESAPLHQEEGKECKHEEIENGPIWDFCKNCGKLL